MDYGFIARFLSEPSDGRAIFLAVLATWALSDADHRGVVSIVTGLIGFIVVLMLSLDPWVPRLGIALATGIIAPFIYKYGMRAAMHYMPWLGDKP